MSIKQLWIKNGFAKNIITYRIRNKDGQYLWNKIEYCKMSGTFDILNDISKKPTLGQVMDMVGNVNHEVIIFTIFTYDSNNKNTLTLVK